jgi:hypothetical protein
VDGEERRGTLREEEENGGERMAGSPEKIAE